MAELLTPNYHDQWININEWILNQLKFDDPKIQVRAYHSPEAALTDHLITFVQFFSHKRTMYFQRGSSPYFEDIIPHLLRETIKVQSLLLVENLTTPEQQEEVLKNLSPDTNCVVVCANHWATREKYNLDILLKGLEAKKVFTLVVNHGDAEMVRQKPSSFTAYLHAMGEITFVVLGSRWRNPTLLSWQGEWSAENFKSNWDSTFSRANDMGAIKKFEQQFPGDMAFSENTLRVFDRATLSFSDLNADLVIQTLIKKMNWTEMQSKEFLATINGCEMPNHPALKSWWRPEPNSNFLRGFLQISASALAQFPQLADQLKSVITELRHQGSWELK